MAAPKPANRHDRANRLKPTTGHRQKGVPVRMKYAQCKRDSVTDATKPTANASLPFTICAQHY